MSRDTPPAAESPTPARGDRSDRRPDAQQLGGGGGAVDLGDPSRPAASDVEPDRLVAQRPRLALEAQRRVEPRSAREDAQAPGRVTHAEADGPFLDVAAFRGSSLTRVTDARPVVDAATLWSSEMRVISAGSIDPLTRTSPAAIDPIADVDVSDTRICER